EMSRVLRRGGTLLLEYENTSPLVRWACRRGYRPPLNRFHPHHLSSPVVVANCRQNGLRLVAAVYTPAFTFTKFRYLGELVSGRRHRGSYEKMVSSTASGPAVFVIHNLLGLGERLLFPLNPMAYAGFTRLKFMKQ
ncbi:MAG: hypothetical protein GY697_28315, partial [Desulfobacterales bacterium]|nr:hypothetical protein [Desulfobacterales bacterium]